MTFLVWRKQNVKHIVYGDTPQEKQAAMEWLKAIADDKNNAHSTHATIIQKILAYYIEKAGDLE
jgi:hypothetical protein